MEEPARRPAPVTVVSEAAQFAQPEALYRAVREREGRFWADADVARLPHVPPGHPQAAEWQIRRQSADRLLGYLSRLGRPQRLLDLGCGNGWLANALACAGHTVYAVDLNHHELTQGARVFGAHPRLQFMYADVFEARLPLGVPLGSAPAKLDGVIIAAAVQYFPNVRALIERLFELLEPGGQIHLLDSPFYTPATVTAARARTQAYYEQLGFPAMLPFYHHHLSGALSTFNPVLCLPEKTSRLGRWFRFWLDRWRRRATPFPWYVITKP